MRTGHTVYITGSGGGKDMDDGYIRGAQDPYAPGSAADSLQALKNQGKQTSYITGGFPKNGLNASGDTQNGAAPFSGAAGQNAYTAGQNAYTGMNAGTQRMYAGQQNTGNPYAGQQSAGNMYGAQQSAGNPYAGQQSAGNMYGAQQNAGNPYTGQQNAGNMYGAQQSAGNPYAGQQNAGNPYAGQQNTGNMYGAQRNTFSYPEEQKTYAAPAGKKTGWETAMHVFLIISAVFSVIFALLFLAGGPAIAAALSASGEYQEYAGIIGALGAVVGIIFAVCAGIDILIAVLSEKHPYGVGMYCCVLRSLGALSSAASLLKASSGSLFGTLLTVAAEIFLAYVYYRGAKDGKERLAAG